MRISDWSSDVCSSDLRELQTRESGSPFASAATDVRIAAVLATGDEDRALSMAQSAAAASDADTSDFVRVAGLLAQQENYVEAADEYQKAIDSFCDQQTRSAEHTSELQSTMRTSYPVLCLKKKQN